MVQNHIIESQFKLLREEIDRHKELIATLEMTVEKLRKEMATMNQQQSYHAVMHRPFIEESNYTCSCEPTEAGVCFCGGAERAGP